MEGKKFGVGLAAGLMLGLVIVTASGGLSSSPSWSGALVSHDLGPVGTTTAAKAAVTTFTTASIPPGFQTGSTNSTHGTGNQTTPSVSVTTTSLNPNSTLDQGSTQSNSPASSSRFSAIASQPLLSNALVFVPVFVAFLLGAIFYRTSSRGKERLPEGSA